MIIPAAGSGKRMGAGFNKLFLSLDNRPIIDHTINIFLNDECCNRIILVVHPNDKTLFEEILKKDHYSKIRIVNGGSERQYSVYNGLKVADNKGIILVHDGARPFIQMETIKQLVRFASDYGAAIAAVPVKDTIKRVNTMKVVETVDRTSLWQIQTPQAFRYSVLRNAHDQAKSEDFLGTDESALVERIGHPVKIVASDYDNIKLTTPEDLYFAKAILEKRKKNSYN